MSQKLVLVTGASQGIGRAIAKELTGSGYQVIGTYNTHKPSPHDTKFFQVDLTNRADRKNFLSRIKTLKFHALVNNAGGYAADSIENTDLSTWDHSLELHLTAPVDLIRNLQPQIEPGGIIVNISSILGSYLSSYDSVSYAATKSALAELTRSFAVMLQKQKVRVNCIAPGLITTDKYLRYDKTWLEKVANQTPIKRLGTPEDIAKITSFLLSDDSQLINGQVLVADGGFTLINDF